MGKLHSNENTDKPGEDRLFMILLSGDWNSRIHQMVLFIQQKFSSSEVLRAIHTQIKDTVFIHCSHILAWKTDSLCCWRAFPQGVCTCFRRSASFQRNTTFLIQLSGLQQLESNTKKFQPSLVLLCSAHDKSHLIYSLMSLYNPISSNIVENEKEGPTPFPSQTFQAASCIKSWR